jgi:hypothetical protein
LLTDFADEFARRAESAALEEVLGFDRSAFGSLERALALQLSEVVPFRTQRTYADLYFRLELRTLSDFESLISLDDAKLPRELPFEESSIVVQIGERIELEGAANPESGLEASSTSRSPIRLTVIQGIS